MEAHAQVELVAIDKSFGSVRILEGLNLSVAPGEFLSLLGPSGCGKTTTLSILAGFLTPDAGEVRLAGVPVTRVPTHRRDLGMVFQRYTLFPHMNVFDNIAFGLRLRKVPQQEVERKVNAALDLVRLPGVGTRFPSQLSGGQQQRIALGRAIIVEPKVLLLDEPLSNLDAKLRREMQVELRRIHEELGTTTIYVTHDQEEALVLSDRIAVMQHGKILQIGKPRAIYDRPRTRFVAEFVGDSNFFSAEVLERRSDRLRVRVDAGFDLEVPVDGVSSVPQSGARIEVALREDRVRLSRQPPSGSVPVRARVARAVYHGTFWKYFLDIGELALRASVPASVAGQYEQGQDVFVVMPYEDLVIVESNGT